MASALDFVKYLIPDNMDLAVDATVGRGKDTLFLAKRAKKVVGFDLQREALLEAKKVLKDFDHVELYQSCHSQMGEVIHQPVDIILFNLGYLPKGNKEMTTRWQTTERAIFQGLKLLKPGGKILIVAYQHEEGKKEISMLKNLNLSQKEVEIFRLTHVNGIMDPPEAWVLLKKD